MQPKHSQKARVGQTIRFTYDEKTVTFSATRATQNNLYGMVNCGSDRGHIGGFEIIETQNSHELFAYSELEQLFRILFSIH